MAFDAFTISFAVKELKQNLIGGKINKINQPNKEEVIFNVYANGKNQKIILSTHAQNARIGITNAEKENPQVAPNFCMLLRKHLLGAEIEDIKQVEFERVIILDLNCKNDLFEHFKKQLVLEVMGKYSNLVLVQDQIIIGAVKQATLELNPERPIFAGVKYTLPKKQDKINPFDKDLAISYFQNFTNQNLSDYLFNGFCGICELTAKEIATRYSFDNAQSFYNNFINFLTNPPINPHVYYMPSFKDFTLFKSEYLLVIGQKFDSLLSATQFLFDKKENEKAYELKKNSLTAKVNAHLKKQEKKKASELQTVLSSQESEINRIKGELILANIYKIKRGDEVLITENFYTDNSPIKINLDNNLALVLEIKLIEIWFFGIPFNRIINCKYGCF